jgi:ferritin-like metal-binding protein YciE
MEPFVRRLHQMLWVEQTLADEILPLVYERVQAVGLKYGVERHQGETKQHVMTVRTCLNLIGERQDGSESPALLGLREELGESDLELADFLSKGEHLEIAAYTWLRSTANALGEEDIAMRLTEILEQEQYALELVQKETAKLLAETVSSTAA